MTRQALTAAALVAVGIALSACSTTTDTPPVDLTGGQDAFDSPTGSATESADDQAAEAALAKMREFYSVQGELDSDAAIPVERLAQVAGGPVLEKYTADILLRRSKAVTSTGAITVVNAQVTDQGVPQDHAGAPIPGAAWVHVVACTDISTWESRYPDGSSAMLSDRGQYEIATLTVRNAEWPEASGWRVTSQTVDKVAAC